MELYYKFEVSRWNNGTDDLTLEQEAAYLRIVNAIHQVGEAIKDNNKVLAGLWRCGPRKVARLKRELIEAGKIEVHGGRIWNERALEEAAKFREYREQQAKKGAKGGKARAEQREMELAPKVEEPEAAPPPEPAPPAPPQEVETDRERVLDAMGHPPNAITPGGKVIGNQIDMLQFAKWRDELGLTMPEILGVVRELVAGKGGDPPTSFRYFTGAMQRFADAKIEAAKPLPKLKTVNGEHYGSERSGGPHRPRDPADHPQLRSIARAAGAFEAPGGDRD